MAKNATRLRTKTFIFIDNGSQWLQRLGKNGSLIALVLIAQALIAQVLLALVLLALVLLEPFQLSPRLLLPLSLLICQFAYNLGCHIDCNPFSNPDSTVDCNLGSQAQAQAQSTTPDASTQEKLDAEAAALRHKALMRAHRKRTIETGRNDHVATPEEYAPELELYKKPPRPDNPLGVNNSSPQATENQVELRTGIKLETEKPSTRPAAGSDQFVAKRMHSENSPAAATVDFKPYMAALSKKIKQNWTPPARQEKTEVSVNFILMPDGAIGNLRITKHGSPSADEAARQAILRAAPFAHMPQGCNVPKQIDYDFSHSSHQDNPSFQWGIH